MSAGTTWVEGGRERCDRLYETLRGLDLNTDQRREFFAYFIGGLATAVDDATWDDLIRSTADGWRA